MKNMGVDYILIAMVGSMVVNFSLTQPAGRTSTESSERSKTFAADQYPIELIMNPKTKYKTALCTIFMGSQVYLYFKNKNTSYSITDLTLHVNHSGAQYYKMPCFYNATDQTFRCAMANLRLLDNELKNVKFKLWATKGDNDITVWKRQKSFNIVKHAFGCRPKTPIRKPVLKTEMSSIDIEWYVHGFIKKLNPTVQVLLDGRVKRNITIHAARDGCAKPNRADDGGCQASITDIDTCVTHKVCLRTLFQSRPYFIKLGINKEQSCWTTSIKNCTLNPPSPYLATKPGMKSWILVIFIIIAVSIMIYAFYNIKKRCLKNTLGNDKKPTNSNSDEDFKIQPREKHKIADTMIQPHFEYTEIASPIASDATQPNPYTTKPYSYTTQLSSVSSCNDGTDTNYRRTLLSSISISVDENANTDHIRTPLSSASTSIDESMEKDSTMSKFLLCFKQHQPTGTEYKGLVPSNGKEQHT